VPVISLDISKAFDRVWHRCLLVKLASKGVHSSIVNWIASYLDQRTLAVSVDGVLSSTFSTNAGVPQGSVLAPLLFLIFIDDLLNSTASSIHSYADDSTLHTASTGSSSIASRHLLVSTINSDLDKILSWGNANLVTFNEVKTHFMLISRKKDSSNFPLPIMNNHSLDPESSLFLLGIRFTPSLNWKNFVLSIARSASSRLGFRTKKLFTAR